MRVELDLEHKECSHCGKTANRTISIDIPEELHAHLGVRCASNIFGLNLTGNPWKAAAKLANHLIGMDAEEIMELIEN